MIYLFIQPIFFEYLLCTRQILGIGNNVMSEKEIALDLMELIV